jgi:hypothetical protein
MSLSDEIKTLGGLESTTYTPASGLPVLILSLFNTRSLNLPTFRNQIFTILHKMVSDHCHVPTMTLGSTAFAFSTTQYFISKGQTQCQRLPHEWGLGKGITEAKSYPRRNSAERRLRTQDFINSSRHD